MDLTVKHIMKKNYETLSPENDLKTTARLMRKTQLDGLPVVSEAKGFVGIMTKANLYDSVAAGLSPDTPIDRLYTKKVITLRENMSYEEAAEIVRTSPVGIAVVLDGDNRVTGFFTKAGWIMAMFNKEAALNSQLNAILQGMHNALWGVDAHGRVTNMNKAAEIILGVQSGDVLGNPIERWLPGLPVNSVLEKAKAAIGIEYQRGEQRLLCNITPVLNGKSGTHAIIVCQDLTDFNRIASELKSVTELYETLQSVMEIAYDGIIVVDEDGRISMVNGAAASFFHKRPDTMVGQAVEKVVENTRLHKVVRTGVGEINRLQFIGGTPYVVSSTPILRGGRVIGAVGKILFRQLEEVTDLAKKLANLDDQLSYYKKKAREKEDEKSGFDQIVTADPIFRRIKDEAEMAARGASNILITGESGTGKELVAQAIHHASFCSKGPLVRVNCAGIPDNLLESEFFGYASGAFTGAQKGGRKGKLAAAHGGTLFLDEIGDMPYSLQGKLLRVLQDKQFEPIGSNKTVQVEVRIIAATNRNLDELVPQGLFRSDLYYRINVVHFSIPPLRERRKDIYLLVHFFLEKYNRIFGVGINDVSDEAYRILFNHNWPGNVRELENVIERAMNFANGNQIETANLPLYLCEKRPRRNETRSPVTFSLKPTRENLERDMISAALEKAGGNKAKAARTLGISRSWLYEKMARTGLK